MFGRRLQKNCSMLRVVVFKVWELMNIYIYRLFDSWVIIHYTKEHGLETRQKSLLYVFVQFVHSPGKWKHCIFGIMKIIYIIILCIIINKFDRVFVALSPAIFTLCISPLATLDRDSDSNSVSPAFNCANILPKFDRAYRQCWNTNRYMIESWLLF